MTLAFTLDRLDKYFSIYFDDKPCAQYGGGRIGQAVEHTASQVGEKIPKDVTQAF